MTAFIRRLEPKERIECLPLSQQAFELAKTSVKKILKRSAW